MPSSGDLIEIIQAGIQSVRPSVLFPNILRNPFPQEFAEWTRAEASYLLCIGKASVGSALAVLNEVNCQDHFILAPAGAEVTGNLIVHFGSHPIPDERSVRSTEELIAWMHSLPDSGRVLVALSGGSSALLVSPLAGLTLESKRKVNDLLIRSGASIHEINTVRKHLSSVKGGRLARKFPQLRIMVLVLSDVIGDDLAVIGSGPFYPDPTTFLDAIDVLHRYRIWNNTPDDARHILESGAAGRLEETPKSIIPPIPHSIIASNRIACSAAANRAELLGYNVQLQTEPVSGSANDVAQHIASRIRMLPPRSALIMGGEITVEVRGTGTGGRNQHLAVLMAELLSHQTAVFAAVGTDGIDGNSPAAGAWTDGQTMARAQQLGAHYREARQNFDSFHFFQRLGQSIYLGSTGTNVMDLYVALT